MKENPAPALKVPNLRGSILGGAMPPLPIGVPAALVALGMALPIVYLAVRTLGAGSETWDLLFRSRTLEIILRTLLLIGAVSAACVVVAVPLAWLTVRTDLPFRRLWSILVSLPIVIPSYIGAFLIIVALGPRGMLQDALGWAFSVERLPDIYGFPGALLTLTLLSYPYVLLTVSAGLWKLDASLEEASRNLGSSRWRTFFVVTLPQLKPSMAAGALLVALYTLSDFGAVSLLQYETLTAAIFVQYDSALDRTIAAALSMVLVVMALLIIVTEAGTRARFKYFGSTPGPDRPAPLVPLGRWRWPAMGYCSLVVLASLAIPVAILLYWVVRGFSSEESMSFVWGAAWSSFYVSALSAALMALAALPVAIMVVRYPSYVANVIERLSYVGFALPGITIALALVFFASNYASPLYQSLALLVFAYVVLFLPTALGSIRASLLQISPKLEEAARGLGSSPVRAFCIITIPLLRSGIFAGAALAFLLTMKELPATLILGPLGFTTLATSVWSAATEAMFAQAAVASLLLVLVSSVPMGFIVLRGRQPG